MRFTAHLYYFGARYYDPAISIWLSVDPLSDSFPGWSPYRYGFDNPLNITDLSGRSEDGFIATWNEEKQDYDEVRVNDKGGSQVDYTEYHGGAVDGQMQVHNKVNNSFSWIDISNYEISPITGYPSGRGALIDANWIIDIAAGGFAAGMLKSGVKAGGNLALRSDIVLSGGRSGQLVKNLTGPANSATKGSGNRMFITNDAGKVIWDVTKDRAKSVIPGQGFGPKIAPSQQHLDLLIKLWGK